MSKNVRNISRENDHAMEMLFADIFKLHEQKLYSLALRITKSDLYAKDVIQEVFLKLWEQRASIHTIKNVEAWLYRLTENKIIDFLRKAAADDRLKEAIWSNLLKSFNETESLVAAKQYNEVIQRAIEQLPPQRKLIYYLNREEGLNYKEIAQELHISRHTVKNQLSSALQSIRRFIGKSARLFSFFF